MKTKISVEIDILEKDGAPLDPPGTLCLYPNSEDGGNIVMGEGRGDAPVYLVNLRELMIALTKIFQVTQ